MDDHDHHEDLIEGLHKQLEPILDSSSQAVYVYLDDNHKICNKKFADLLGYASPEEWAQISDSFTDTFVEDSSQKTLVTTFQEAMEKMTGSKIDVRWKKKDGGSVDTSVILVPFSHDDHIFAVHFISEN